ncbi:C-type lectin domain family 4 member E-like [Engraulis encrasicolus]|uniref:C-type lectin domain family 4 member E-like n=1 Tax=Engraulis encrasicolus TaxID=184585 RepID=UPI002FD44CE3
MAVSFKQFSFSILVGWSSFQSSLYFFSRGRASWYTARVDCRQRGADLVIISSLQEQVYLSRQRYYTAWIGLTDRETEGVWKWVDETPLTVGYWMQSQPDNWRGREDCAHLHRYRRRWNVEDCNEHLSWICEMKV